MAGIQALECWMKRHESKESSLEEVTSNSTIHIYTSWLLLLITLTLVLNVWIFTYHDLGILRVECAYSLVIGSPNAI